MFIASLFKSSKHGRGVREVSWLHCMEEGSQLPEVAILTFMLLLVFFTVWVPGLVLAEPTSPHGILTLEFFCKLVKTNCHSLSHNLVQSACFSPFFFPPFVNFSDIQWFVVCKIWFKVLVPFCG